MALSMVRLAALFLLPITQDEAYYRMWSFFPALGYLDHPPMVAWLIAPFHNFANDHLIRMGSFIALCLAFPITAKTFRELGLKDSQLVYAQILAHANLFVLPIGFLALPDGPFVLMWIIALHEATVAIKRDPKRWVTAGLACGAGLWSKYLMLLIGPIFLLTLLKSKRLFRSPWPILGGVACLLVIAPHLAWNAQNDWVTFRFQMNHGFAGSHEVADLQSNLPVPKVAPPISSEYMQASVFFPKKPEKPKRKKSEIEQIVTRALDFSTAQPGLLAFLLIPVALSLVRIRKRNGNVAGVFSSPEGKLHFFAIVFTLGIFFTINLFQGVEANWSGFYLLSVAPWLASLPLNSKKVISACFALNLALVLAVAGYGFGLERGVITNTKSNRVAKEIHGFNHLATYVSQLGDPLFADTYQTVSMLSLASPRTNIQQLPLITRHSELTRNPSFAFYDKIDLEKRGSFLLLLNQAVPPRFSGFRLTSLEKILDCKDGDLQLLSREQAIANYETCEPFHEWLVARYVVD